MTDTQPPTPDIDTIQARTNAATPGPWNTDARHPKYIFGAEGPVVARTGINPAADADAAFIAHARTDVPALIAYARHLETRTASLEAEHDGWAEAGRNESRILAARVAELETEQADTESGIEVLQTRLWLIEQYLRTTPHHTVARDLTDLVEGAIDPASIDDYRSWLATDDLDTTPAPVPARDGR